MSVGLPATKNEIDTRAGDMARQFQKQFNDVATLKGYLDRTSDAELEALGYTPEDVTLLKSAIGDLAQLGQIWTGLAALPAAKDFRTFVAQLWGVGAF